MFAGILALAGGTGLAAHAADVVRHPLNAGVALEYGQIFNSTDFWNGPHHEQFTMHRTVGWFIQRGSVGERFDITAGVGGMFFYFYPLDGYSYSRAPQSAVSLAQVSGAYTWGDLGQPSLKLTFGLLPYKYNPEAKNLGEYLFRSTPYPSTTINGSWEVVNSSMAKIWGFVLEKPMLEGKWKNDLVISMSTSWPLYDLSAAYLTSLRMGMLEVGGGVNLFRILPNRPSMTTPKKLFNAYFTHQGVDYYANSFYYQNIADFYQASGNPDSARYSAMARKVDSLNTAVDAQGNPAPPAYSYYTVQGTELMGRFSLDLGSAFGSSMDLKLYGEAALLGLANYPVFYEDRMSRMPMMVGINLPTFGLLDKLGVEVEYWKNQFINDYSNVTLDGQLQSPVPDYKNAIEHLKADPTRHYTKDDLKWSLYARKSLGSAFAAYVQVARDHLRPIYAPAWNPLESEVLLDDKGWYYAFRVQMGI